MTKRLRLIGTRILDEFARVVYANQNRAFRLWLISPWIGSEEGRDPLYLLIEAMRRGRCDIFVVTRHPTSAWHQRSIELLREHTKAIIYYSDSLHTKLYIVECNGFRCAVVGSPNLTPRANTFNRELAIELRTTINDEQDDIATIITELTEYASSLRAESDLR